MVDPDGTTPRRHGRGSRVPPHDIQAEESLLGAMMLDSEAIAVAAGVLRADDFYKPAHAHIYDAIHALYASGQAVDPVTVADELRRNGLLEQVGGHQVLVDIMASTPATTNAAGYARIVEEHALLRRLIAVAGEIAELGYSLPEDITKALDRAESMVYDVNQRRVTDSTAKIEDLLGANLDRLEHLYGRGEAITGVPTGYLDLDELLSGLQPSSLVVVGARPSMGKCVAWDTPIVDPATGAVRSAAEVHATGLAGRDVSVAALGVDGRVVTVRPGAFVDDGQKPVFRVRTRSGRVVRTTGSHPFLTPGGWRPLADLAVGQHIGVPAALPIFGSDELPPGEVTALARAVAAPEGAGSEPATERRVPAQVFRLRRPLVARFLCEVLGRTASVWRAAGGRPGRVRLTVLSERLARDLQHLLLRFGICADVTRAVVAGDDATWVAYDVSVEDAGRLAALGEDTGRLATLGAGTGAPAAPGTAAAGFPARAAAGSAAPAATFAAAAIAGGPAHPLAEPVAAGVATPVGGGFAGGERGLRAGAAFAGGHRDLRPGAGFAGGDRGLRAGGGLADGAEVECAFGGPGSVADPVELEVGVACGRGSAVMWDEIVAIEADGVEQVYDLTVPGLHNFVAADVFVHNTSFALGMAAHASLHANAPVLLFSLEMGSLELSQRLLCAEARIDSARVRTGRLTEDDWSRISQAIGRLASAPIWIDDNPNLTVMEIRAKARRLKSQVGDLGMVVVDYLQLMSGRANAENRQVEVSEISRGLKILARELECPVVALSQLSRQLEMRADKRPMLADLRESGCLTADARVLRADTGTEVTIGELAESGARDVPVWSLDTDLRMVPALMTRAFPTGVKEVFQLRLASGHELTASANHPFLTVDGWARLDELAVGSGIAVPRVVPTPKEAGHRPDDEVRRLARRAARSGPGDRPSDAPTVPPAVFSLTDEQVALFLRQLWAADGCAGWWGRARVHYTSTSRRMVDDVRLLLLRLGIRSVVRPAAGPPGRSGYRLSIEGPDDQLAFVDRVGARARRRSAYDELRARLSREEAPTGSTAGSDGDDADPVVGPLAMSDAAWEQVVAIEPRGECPVFDATVEGTHNFVANGITVENSIEQDADVVMFIYRDEVYHPDSPDRGQAEIIVSKHRNGPTGLCRLAFLEQFTRFANMARVDSL